MKREEAIAQQALIDVLRGGSDIGGLGVNPLTPKEMISNLSAQGYKIVKDDPAAERRRIAAIDSFRKARWAGGDVVKVGVLSCSHLGSRHQQLTFLESFYDRCVEEQISEVLHAGDVSDGDGHVYKGHGYDIFVHGADRQVAYIEEKYPQREGVKTHMIAGNHDWSFYQRGGYDLIENLSARRKDIVYHGPMGAKVFVDGVHFYLAHGDGGVAYARSYKPQRRIEQFAPEQKPEVLLLGHYHVWDHLPMYRNVVSWQLGCFQSQTDYLKRKGLYPEIGGLILTIYRGTKGADRPGGFVRVVGEVVPFFVPKENDY